MEAITHQLYSKLPPISLAIKVRGTNMQGIAGKAGANSLATFSFGLLHMDTPVLADQQRLIHISSVQTLDVARSDG